MYECPVHLTKEFPLLKGRTSLGHLLMAIDCYIPFKASQPTLGSWRIVSGRFWARIWTGLPPALNSFLSWAFGNYLTSQGIPCLLLNRKFISLFTRTRHCTLSWVNSILSTSSFSSVYPGKFWDSSLKWTRQFRCTSFSIHQSKIVIRHFRI